MKNIINNSEDNINYIIELYNNFVSIKQIAKLFNVGETTMFRFFTINNIKTRTRQESYQTKHLNDFEKEQVLKLYFNSGLNREEIAKKLNLTQYSVKKLIKENVLKDKGKFLLNFSLNKKIISYEQKQLILGSLLGDASLCRRKRKCKQYQYEFSIIHGEKQLEYLNHSANILNCNVLKGIQKENSFGAGNAIYRINYHNKYELEPLYNMTHINGIKSITDDWLKEIDALGIAYWFMDDGSSYRSKKCGFTVQTHFHTQSFNKNDHEKLIIKLNSFGIESTISKVQDGTEMNIYIKQNSVNKLMDLIDPYIVDCMKYKIKRK